MLLMLLLNAASRWHACTRSCVLRCPPQVMHYCVEPLHFDRVTARRPQTRDQLPRPNHFVVREGFEKTSEDPGVERCIGHLAVRQGPVLPIAHPVFLEELQAQSRSNVTGERALWAGNRSAGKRILQIK
jgi:hypothetical protein